MAGVVRVGAISRESENKGGDLNVAGEPSNHGPRFDKAEPGPPADWTAGTVIHRGHRQHRKKRGRIFKRRHGRRVEWSTLVSRRAGMPCTSDETLQEYGRGTGEEVQDLPAVRRPEAREVACRH